MPTSPISSPGQIRLLMMLTLTALAISLPNQIAAQEEAAPASAGVVSLAKASVGSPRSASSSPSTLPLPAVVVANIDPFEAIEREDEAGNTFNIEFTRTDLVKSAKAKAQVSLRGQTLLVRMSAKDLPAPTAFDVPRYALWVYVPNYQVKLYIGDLPISINSKSNRKDASGALGNSESAYQYTILPPEAEFGGLMLTAEPVRFTPIVNEALRPVLVALTPESDAKIATAAPTYYAGPLPKDLTKQPSSSKPAPKNNP